MREEFVLPPPVPADSPFQLRLAGVSYCDGSYRIERETADFSVVEYVERGTGTLEIDGEEFHPSAGDLYFLPEGSRQLGVLFLDGQDSGNQLYTGRKEYAGCMLWEDPAGLLYVQLPGGGYAAAQPAS